ncbi:hypothetical protein [Rhodococcus coprophilus]|uniref:Uncharacterized protein n=1 Tax=Rhodococcus coprophilus TaxID=38310 RepID=A0A2X4UJ23_9NOCA|nr:hypothetical protein [Rhodococcus coprophilus]MBM7458577.1 hypothetical protein [Rhodococcus coprophilus]SQI32920.1 Uncharacterised protein [Rhodococcus coprophilus]
MPNAHEQEAAFQLHLTRSENYVRAIHEAGDLAWFEHGHPNRYVILARLGLDDDIDETDLRRALFMRRYP